MMRFLGGLIIGGITTLLVATALNVRTDALVDRVQDYWRHIDGATGGAVAGASAETEEIDAADLVHEGARGDPVGDMPSPPRGDLPEADAKALETESAEWQPLSSADIASAVSRSGREAVWVPFRSRSSAQGFAEQLSRVVGHAFQVERHGPGRYQVMFGYLNEEERQGVLERVREVAELPE